MLKAAALPPPPTAALTSVPQAELQQVQAENAALVAELASLSADATRTERTVREIATLNQMFSSQVMLQASQIEQLYEQVSNFFAPALCLGNPELMT